VIVLSPEQKATYESIRQTALVDLESIDEDIAAELARVKGVSLDELVGRIAPAVRTNNGSSNCERRRPSALLMADCPSPMRRAAQPADVADLISALVHNTYLTGEVVVLDGGLNLR
jgi:NAD(P)-dependent dehydrogenase (short-subunit alcohol dehydrogenase family)